MVLMEDSFDKGTRADKAHHSIRPTAMKNTLIALTSAALAFSTASCGKSDRTQIVNKGSDTMLEVAQSWSEQYRKVNPKTFVSVSGGGSGQGITAMIDGRVDIANCSRQIKPKEEAAAKAKGQTPVQHKVGFDGIAIFVHKDNPIESISLEQLKQIYIEGGTITKWSELGVTMPEGAEDEIVVLSRQSNSGTYEYFRESILGKAGKFRFGTRDLVGSKEVVETLINARTAMGYSGLAYATPQVKMVPVINKDSGAPVTPSIANVVDGSYPISRPLWMYTDGEPQGAVKEYLDWILSDDGQRVLRDSGYPPVRVIDG
ncbi:MAG: phosphate ABC transporter substrate-binding protein [Planctomycetota bacterium]|nr:phosphate ABC transporter substrate-binding protein [Planctomycetota bacterium]